MQQDEVQALCSRYKNSPPPEVAQKILTSQQQSFKYPSDGKLMGDWKEGEKLASIGTGGHIGRIQPDPPDRKKGGNCYACHLMAPKEVAAGTIGPSLTAYGKLRGNSPEVVKYTYEKIYNAQAFAPCSMMPRFGHNGWLTPKQIADSVAFLLDPESPVNR
jgi:sulfur-oxidizing protein SoxX